MMPDGKHTKSELKKLLTKKQVRFCHEYIYDWNGGRSYRAAYPDCKTDNGARVNASRLLTNTNIIEYIDLIKNDYEAEAGVSKLMAIMELKKFAFHSFDDIHDSWFKRKDFDKLPKEVKSCIQEIDTKILTRNIGTHDEPEIVDVEYVKIKLVDKRGALQDLAKLMGWNEAEKIDHSMTIQYQNVSKQFPNKK